MKNFINFIILLIYCINSPLHSIDICTSQEQIDAISAIDGGVFIDFVENNLKGKKVHFYPNIGNAGDALIWYGTISFFNKLGIHYIASYEKESLQSQNVDIFIYGGGGNLVPYYKNCSNFFLKFLNKGKPIVLFPHTVQGHQKLLESLPSKVTLFCREHMSYDYCKNIVQYPENVFFSCDMAFYADLKPFFVSQKDHTEVPKELFAFRLDDEANALRKPISLPKSNIDISRISGNISLKSSYHRNYAVVQKFLNTINAYDIVWTDRLHVGIGAFLLGKEVHLFDNSYGKNRAVYESTIRQLDTENRVTFHDDWSIIREFS